METSTKNFVDVIKACESAEGAGTKKIIQAALDTLVPEAHQLVSEALNPYRVFGVRKFERLPKHEYSGADQPDIALIMRTLNKLASGELTGNAARTAWATTLAEYTWETAQYLERIIDKDLKAGFSVDTVNKVCAKKHGIIPTFEVMLADKCESQEDFEDNITFPCQGDFKYDGERTIAVYRQQVGRAVYYSRSGKIADHIDGIFDEELRRLRDHLGYDFVLDGERFASNFTETMNAKKEGNEEAKKNLRLRAFFLMPLSDWQAKKTKITMKEARKFLEKNLELCMCEKIILSEGREVKDYQDMMAFCNEAIDVHKQEGLILKDWDATYEWDRTLAWCKVKRFYDVDCRVVGFYTGRPKSRLEHTLGGINVVGFLEDGARIETNVGSGFSDELRAEIWNNQESWLGRTVVIKYQEVTKSKGKEVASLRFPTFERDRNDKVVEI